MLFAVYLLFGCDLAYLAQDLVGKIAELLIVAHGYADEACEGCSGEAANLQALHAVASRARDGASVHRRKHALSWLTQP